MGVTPRKVVIGDDDTEYTIQRFKGLKAIMAMASVTRIGREVPDIMADAVKQYQNRNTIIITESMARLPRWQSFTKEDFDAAEAKTGKRQIELPTPMTANEQVLYSLPTLLEKARKEVTRLLALMIIPNSELRDADKSDTVEDALDKYEEVLLYDAELDQLVDLCFATQDVLTEQLADRKDRLGNLTKSVLKGFRTTMGAQAAAGTPQESQQPSTEAKESSNGGAPSMLPISTQDAPTSSTSSGEPTDGTETQPSTESLGVS